MEVFVKYKWLDHGQNLISQFSNFWKQDLFTDCTILCGGKMFPVHRLVLGSCSEYFKEVFDNAQCCHPIIIMNDISSENLRILLNCIYQVNLVIPQRKLLAIAEEARTLKIKGLEALNQFVSNTSSSAKCDISENFRLLQKSLSPVVSLPKLDDALGDFSNFPMKRKVPKEWDSEKKVRKVDDSACVAKVKITKSVVQEEDSLLSISFESNDFEATDADEIDFIGFNDAHSKQDEGASNEEEERNVENIMEVKPDWSIFPDSLCLEVLNQRQDEECLDEDIVKEEEEEILPFPLEKSLLHDSLSTISTPNVEHYPSSEATKQFEGEIDEIRLTPDPLVPTPTEAHTDNTAVEMISNDIQDLATPLEVQRRKRPKRPCPYCNQFRTLLKRHISMVHKREEKVKEILTLSPKKQRKNFDLLRKEGIHKENNRILRTNAMNKVENKLLVERRSLSKTLKKCPICHGYFVSRYFPQHFKRCKTKSPNHLDNLDPVKVSAKTGVIMLEDDISKVAYTPRFVSSILEKFIDDDVGNLCRTDPLIKYVGFYLFTKRSEDENDVKKQKTQVIKKDVMSKMRSVARFSLNMRKVCNNDNLPIQEMFDRSLMSKFKDAVRLTINVASEAKYQLGYLLILVTKILQSRLSCLMKEKEGIEMTEFVRALSNPINWVPLFGKQENYASRKSTFDIRRPKNLPRESDLKVLNDYLIKTLTTLSNKNVDDIDYVLLRRILLTRLTFMNAGRGGEPCRLLISQWEEAKNDDWLNLDFVKHNLEREVEDKELLDEFKIAFQKGKGIKSVSIMIPKECIKPLQILCNAEFRQKNNISPDNHFVFATQGNANIHSQGVSDINIIIRHFGLKLKAKDMRYYLSTPQAMMELPEDSRKLFYLHMGHEEHINKTSYQSERVLERVIKVGKILRVVDQHLLQQDPLVPTPTEAHTDNTAVEMISNDFQDLATPLESKSAVYGPLQKVSAPVEKKLKKRPMQNKKKFVPGGSQKVTEIMKKRLQILSNSTPRTKKIKIKNKYFNMRKLQDI